MPGVTPFENEIVEWIRDNAMKGEVATRAFIRRVLVDATDAAAAGGRAGVSLQVGAQKEWNDDLRMRRVVVESPYAARGRRYGHSKMDLAHELQENVDYARAALRDCLIRGEAPIASHLLYTQEGVLRDDVPAERELGIEAGLVWGRCADATIVYADHGITDGMTQGIERATCEDRTTEIRRIKG